MTFDVSLWCTPNLECILEYVLFWYTANLTTVWHEINSKQLTTLQHWFLYYTMILVLITKYPSLIIIKKKQNL